MLDPLGTVPDAVACNTTAPIVSVRPSPRAWSGKLLAWKATPWALAGAAMINMAASARQLIKIRALIAFISAPP